jgi:hypothetical protein
MYTPQIVTVTGPGRHEIVPTPEWFSAYTQFLAEQAVFAEQHSVELLSVGTELNSTGQYDSEWRSIVAAVRPLFTGQLTYQANTNWTPEGDPGWNWDISWWDALDYIGANFYVFESVHAQSVDPTIEQLRELYRPFVLKLADLSQACGKSVVITEIGPISVDGFTHFDPQSLYPYLCDPQTLPDFQEQADFAATVMQLVSESSFIEGVFWSQWELTTEDWTQTGLCWPRSSVFVFKPMERVLSSWYHSH